MLLIEEEEEGCQQPRTVPQIGQPSTAACICTACGILSPPPCIPSLGTAPSCRGPMLAPTNVFLPPHFLPQSGSPTAQPTPQWHPPPSPPAPRAGMPWGPSPCPREPLTHIVILEGMEKVASQLPVVSWSARGIANATYVVWRILREMRRGRQ